MEIPKFNSEESKFYQELLTRISIEIGIPEYLYETWQVNDETSRLHWYFIAKDLEKSHVNYFKFINSIDSLKSESEIWYRKWNEVLSEINELNCSKLYESSEQMQELRTRRPPFKFEMEEKLRYKIFEFVKSKYKKGLS